MRTRAATCASVLMSVLALALARPAHADTLSDSVEQFLRDAQRQVDEARVWKIHLKPSFRQSVVWTDNVFLEADNEDPFRITGVQIADNSRPPNRNPAALRALEDRIGDFQLTEVEGRVDDVIFRSNLNMDFVIPVNPEYTKLFQQDALRIFQADMTFNKYVNNEQLDDFNYSLNTDVFGILKDIFPNIPKLQGRWGSNLWVRVSNEYSRITEPLDVPVVEFTIPRIFVKKFDEFERIENTANLDMGYRGNNTDWQVGFEHYILQLDDQQLRQAEHTRRNFHVEVGANLPWFQEKRGYVRYDLWTYRYGHRSGKLTLNRNFFGPVASNNVIPNETRALNNAEVHRIVTGVNGFFLARKLQGRGEIGYMEWDADNSGRGVNGLSRDNNDYHNIVGLVEAAYKPWDERPTTFQFSYANGAYSSAISNFRVQHKFLFSVLHEFIPKRLRGDFSVGFTRNSVSEGPKNDLWEIGFGLNYSLFEQLDVSLRYLWRHSISQNELFIQGAIGRQLNPGGAVYRVFFESESDGDYEQNVVELGATLSF